MVEHHKRLVTADEDMVGHGEKEAQEGGEA